MGDPVGGIRCTSDGPIARLTIDRPARANAIDGRMIGELESAWRSVAADDGCRVVVIRGAGGRHFCAGADRSEPKSADASRRYATAMREVIAAMRAIDRPTLACVDGAAVGFGAMLALNADLLLAAPEARFSLPEMQLGMPPEIACDALDGRVSASVARYLLLTGLAMTSEELASTGVKVVVAPRAQLDERLLQLATTLARIERGGMAALRARLGRRGEAIRTPDRMEDRPHAR